MPLSDHEQQVLQEIERQFYEQDPKFARGVASTTLKKHAALNIRRGAAIFALGLLGLFAFFFRPLVIVGVAAFLLMLAGATMVYYSARRAGADQIKSLREGALQSKIMGRIEDQVRKLRKRDGR
jgi:DUF3040 family protein